MELNFISNIKKLKEKEIKNYSTMENVIRKDELIIVLDYLEKYCASYLNDKEKIDLNNLKILCRMIVMNYIKTKSDRLNNENIRIKTLYEIINELS